MNTLCERCTKPLFEHASDYMVREGHACRGDCKAPQSRQVTRRASEPLQRETKYGNRKTACGYGHVHDSIKEAGRCNTLNFMQLGGTISDLEIQPKYEFRLGDELIGTYKGDFKYTENGVLVIEDVKSVATAKRPDYRLRKKMMKAFFDIEVNEV